MMIPMIIQSQSCGGSRWHPLVQVPQRLRATAGDVAPAVIADLNPPSFKDFSCIIHLYTHINTPFYSYPQVKCDGTKLLQEPPGPKSGRLAISMPGPTAKGIQSHQSLDNLDTSGIIRPLCA